MRSHLAAPTHQPIQLADPPRNGGDERGTGNGQHPGPDDTLGDSHRTADSLRVAPTPMMAPVMVCVVETGMPKPVAMNSVIAPPGLGAKAADRLELGDPHAHGLHDPPAAEQRAERDRGLAD